MRKALPLWEWVLCLGLFGGVTRAQAPEPPVIPRAARLDSAIYRNVLVDRPDAKPKSLEGYRINFVGMARDEDFRAFMQEIAHADLNRLGPQLPENPNDPSSKLVVPPDYQMAFWINAYNAYVVQGIADALTQNPNLKSVKDIKGFFSEKRCTIAKTQYSLDQIEKEILRKFKQPLVMFGLFRGGRGGPKLYRAFYGNDLQDALEEAATLFLSDPEAIQVIRLRQTVLVPEVLSWYEKDAEKVKQYLITYLQRRKDARYLLLGSYKMEYKSFDWKLVPHYTASVNALR
ncbi:MAG: DUF547 domain-containing protein [Abditibacteriales bacterium]|nr:DUF547 domain-containing protein [Abditibacteriales bacterium]MDW8365091.1 DUF547 domain-containing protein [Abditibacteriales bacterium]